MEVRPEAFFNLRMTESEFKLMCACVALCAGVPGVRVDRREANELNISLLENRTRHANDQAKLAAGALEKARANVVDTDPE